MTTPDRPPRAAPPAWQRYLLALVLVAATSGVGLVIRWFIAPANLVMLFLLAVVVAALRLGRGPAILVAVVSVLAFDFFFVPPHLTFEISDSQYLLTFLGLLVAGLVISNLAAEARDRAEEAERRAAETTLLYRLSRDLASAGDLAGITQAVTTHVAQTFAREAAILLPGGEGLAASGASPGFVLDQEAQTIAAWVLAHGEAAGRGSPEFADARARYLPLKTARGVVGVLAVEPPDPAPQLTTQQRRLLQAFASQAALALERAGLAEAAGKTHLLEATERLQTAVLNSISHDLRTPLASITGALSSLRDTEVQLDEATRAGLIDDAYNESERLNRLVGNLLNMSRLQAGAMRVKETPTEIGDLVGAALTQLEGRLRDRPVTLHIPRDLPLVPMDLALMLQVMVNVLDNAVKYSPAGSPIDVRARQEGQSVAVEIDDRGIGIPPVDLDRVFDKFFRVARPAGRSAGGGSGDGGGTGLGLSISKGIVEAHGGRIEARARKGGGTSIVFTLPLTAGPEAPGTGTPEGGV